MCGRFTLRATVGTVAEQFAIFELPPFSPRFNIAPTQPVPVVRLDPETSRPNRQLVWLHWGLIPSWAKDPAIGNRMINARAETAAEKPSYRAAMRRRRCLIVADGFYEWQKTTDRKQPYFIHMADQRPFAFAGLWEAWEGADHSYIESCTILTTEPNDLLRPIHNRMPVILAAEHYDRWLDPTTREANEVLPLLKPFSSDPMAAYPVGTLVNNPKNDEPACVAVDSLF